MSPLFVGALRIRNECAWIAEVLESLLPLCQRVVVFDDHSIDGTPDICRKYPQVDVYDSEFQGLDESRDKTFLLKKVIATKADYVVHIDGDEVLERTGPRRLRSAVAVHPEASVFRLKVAYLWDSPRQIRIDGLYANFTRPSMFRLRGERVDRLHFATTAAGGNLHCSNFPVGLKGHWVDLPQIRLKHYGYMEEQKRRAKYEYYNMVDPHNENEDCYRHIIETPGAKFAPGPTELVPWAE